MKYMSKKITFLGLAAILFIGGVSYVAADGFSAASGIVTSLFELSPKESSYTPEGLIADGFLDIEAYTTDANTLFRMAGPSIFDALTASQTGSFDNLLVGAGYTEAAPITTEVQVAGAIQIEQLLDDTGAGNKSYLCINDFGVMSRCPGVAIGTPECISPAYGANSDQQATDTITGCAGGVFFDIEDTTLTEGGGGSHEWGCRGTGESIALNDSDPTDVLCSHANALEELDGGGAVILPG